LSTRNQQTLRTPDAEEEATPGAMLTVPLISLVGAPPRLTFVRMGALPCLASFGLTGGIQLVALQNLPTDTDS